ncbi:MAG: hydratase [Desulfobacterales bacterium]|nr:hydratase [Desulfobacterales bacterium]
MTTISKAKGIYLINNMEVVEDNDKSTQKRVDAACRRQGLKATEAQNLVPDKLKQETIAYGILQSHNKGRDKESLNISFDSLASHDITYVGITQTARAGGLERFPLPHVLTNCHNSLCAVGGTINEDDHVFGLSAAKKYGGIFVPTHLAVIHQYVREMMSGCGRMILGADSHTRYGALGTMGVGEGAPELVKQLLGETWDIQYPDVVAVYLEGTPPKGTGPQDVALALVAALFQSGYVKNKVMEFVGPGISNLSVEFRIGIDVMTTETTCLSSIWTTDKEVKKYYRVHGRENDFSVLAPGPVAYYDGLVRVDLSKIEPMIALPFHPSNAYAISDFKKNAGDILRKTEKEAAALFDRQRVAFSLADKVKGKKVKIDQGIVAGCSGGMFENISAMADIIAGADNAGSSFQLSVYPASQPINLALTKNKSIQKLLAAGVVIRSAFCGPCFGAGDTPANNALSIRHTTRNFPNREGSKPGEGQIAAVALMDARSIAATYRNGGYLTSAAETLDYKDRYPYRFEKEIYDKKVYNGFRKPLKKEALVMGPNIADWPKMDPLPRNLLLTVVSILQDPVTTTDELIPSGETASYRSNPLRLAEFTLSRKDPGYVQRAKDVQAMYHAAKNSSADKLPAQIKAMYKVISARIPGFTDMDSLAKNTGIGSLVYAIKPGDGSAREQAASCQKVLGTWANIAREYATKRYRSNCINWGVLPFISESEKINFSLNSSIFLPGIRTLLEEAKEDVSGWIIENNTVRPLKLSLPGLTEKDRQILLAGNMINYQAGNRKLKRL